MALTCQQLRFRAWEGTGRRSRREWEGEVQGRGVNLPARWGVLCPSPVLFSLSRSPRHSPFPSHAVSLAARSIWTLRRRGLRTQACGGLCLRGKENSEGRSYAYRCFSKVGCSVGRDSCMRTP